MSQLAEGDVIAIKHLDTAGDSGDATGHVMVVAGAPSRYDRDGTTEYSGIGRGWFFIQTTAADVPTGYWWGANENLTTQYRSVTGRPLLFQAII